MGTLARRSIQTRRRRLTGSQHPKPDEKTLTLLSSLLTKERELSTLRKFVLSLGFNPSKITIDIDDPKFAFSPKPAALTSLLVTRDFSNSGLSETGKVEAEKWLDSISLKKEGI